MNSNWIDTILLFLTITTILNVSTYILSYTQTLRNIVSFAFLCLCIAFGLGLSFGIQFYPIFFLLVYVGAIIVSTLYVVLTCDIRLEYKQIRVRVENFGRIIVWANIIDIFFCAGWLFLIRANPSSSAIGPLSVSDAQVQEAYQRCLTNHPELANICESALISRYDRSLYGQIIDHTNDFHVVSSNFYTNYSFLFIMLGILLSVSLISALAILKHK